MYFSKKKVYNSCMEKHPPMWKIEKRKMKMKNNILLSVKICTKVEK